MNIQTYQKILGGMLLGGVVYIGTQFLDESPVACDVATGTLNWNNPESFDTLEDTVLIFAKKQPNGNIDYIDIGVPSKPPGTYGSPDTNLGNIEGGIPLDLQYENDPDAMLIYADTGNYCNVVGLDDSTYYYAVFNVDNGSYSNGQYAVGKTIAVEGIQDVVLANSSRLQFIKWICYDTDTVIAVLSTDSISIAPNGYASSYLTGVDTDWNQNTSYFNGVDDSEGKVMYVDFGDLLSWRNLPEQEVWVFLWTNRGDCWSKSTYKTFDTR